MHDGKKRLFGVKTLSKEYRKNREHVGYLKREATIGQKLDHRRVIRVHEFGIDRGNPYLAIEWFPSRNLKLRLTDGLERIGHLVPKIVEQAAEGLHYLHCQGWVHRDVKPDNFLADDDGNVKLIDFALAVRSRTGLIRLFARRSKKVQGTRSYISPEQIRCRPLDVRADIYSFGCTIYHFLAGNPPFTGGSANELLNKHLKAPPPSLAAINANITPGFADLLRQTMAKDPEDRPQSLDEFLAELHATRVYVRIPRPPENTPKVDSPEKEAPPKQRG